MSEPYIGEIRAFPFGFAPRGWAACEGQLLSISQNTPLFSILGTNYGGDGISLFALPDLRGLAPMGAGQGPGLTPRPLGTVDGTETVALIESELAPHTHTPRCSTGNGNSYVPASGYWAVDAGGASEYGAPGQAKMAANALQPTGGGQPHTNMQPYLALSYCIALQGLYPTKS